METNQQHSLPVIGGNKFNDLSMVTPNGMTNLLNTKNFVTKNTHNSMNNMETMKLSNKLTISLKSTLDVLDLIPEYEEKNYEDYLNNNDILKNRKNEEKKDEGGSLDDINRFNFSIIKNQQWGNNNGGKISNSSFAKHPIRPNRKELEREMGKFCSYF